MPTKRKIRAQKQCSCQSTNCLKRYCICFAAEKYCTEACSCKECFNELDYKSKVDKAREEAEVRNPLAFATKKDRDRLMPSVEKYKKGCVCRKAMCMLEYCHCYKSEVGCLAECGCVECKNVYGKRGYNFDMVPMDQLELMNQSTLQDINDTHTSSVTNLPYILSPAESSTPDTMIGTSTSDSAVVHVDQTELMNQFTPQNMNIPYIQFQFSNPEMIIGTSTRAYDLDLPTEDQLEFMNRFKP